MRRISGLVGLALLCAALAPSVVDAHDRCSRVSILSRRSVGADTPAVNPHELVICTPGQGLDHVADTRIIQPGATHVSIRYASSPPPSAGSPAITATLSGLIVGQHQLTPKEVVDGVWTYASAWIVLPAGAQGTLTAAVGTDTATYRTVA